MQSLVYTAPGTLEWRDVPDAGLAGDHEAIVRHVAVATCDLDALIVHGRTPFPPPFSVGHEGVAEVLEIGDAVRTVRPGDLVVVPFQISCGTCAACRAGRTGNCESVPTGTAYGFGAGPDMTRFGGFLADAVRVPYADAMLIPLPAGLAPEVAAGASDNLVDAYRCVGPALTARPQAPVLVVGGGGAGSIGLYAAGQAVALGSERVLYVDADSARRAVAERFGADTLDHIPDRVDRRFGITVDASGTKDGLALALNSLDRDGLCTSASIFFDPAEVPAFPLLQMYVVSSTFVTGRIHARRDAPAVLDLLAAGTFDPSPVTTRAVAFDDAADALLEPFVKLIFARGASRGV